MVDRYTIRRTERGFLVLGKGGGMFGTRIFVPTFVDAEAIREALRCGDRLTVSTILLNLSTDRFTVSTANVLDPDR